MHDPNFLVYLFYIFWYSVQNLIWCYFGRKKEFPIYLTMSFYVIAEAVK
ncbi:MAG: hypothetical protein HY232_15140 [Acidobacteria bacterium]|nr:hypothetical protein [Acidobacteriota bacterium]